MDINELLGNSLDRDNIKIAPPAIKTQQDIINLVRELDPSNNEPANVAVQTTVPLSGQIHNITMQSVSVSKRELLRQAISKAVLVEQASKQLAGMHAFGVNVSDKLIYEITGGRRVGHNICWTIGEWTYKYDIAQHKLVRDHANS